MLKRELINCKNVQIKLSPRNQLCYLSEVVNDQQKIQPQFKISRILLYRRLQKDKSLKHQSTQGSILFLWRKNLHLKIYQTCLNFYNLSKPNSISLEDSKFPIKSSKAYLVILLAKLIINNFKLSCQAEEMVKMMWPKPMIRVRLKLTI